jgi:hypothetical protein
MEDGRRDMGLDEHKCVEFTQEHLERIIETNTLLKELIKRLDKTVVPCINDHDDRLDALEKLVGKGILPKTEEDVNDHERRIRVLEEWQWKVMGVVVGINAAFWIGIALLNHFWGILV